MFSARNIYLFIYLFPYVQSKEIVKIARNLLEYTKQEVKITKHVADMLLKNNGEFLQAVIDEFGLVRLILSILLCRNMS